MIERDSTKPEPIGISVVVPSLNQGRFIDQALQSLLDQKYPNLEVIVMDGGSQDDTIQRLKAYGKQIQWRSDKDEGQSDAIMKGIARTTKPWLTWLNSDDVQCGNALWRVNEAVAAHPEAEVVVGQGHYMDEDGSNPRPYPTIDVSPNSDVLEEIFQKGFVAQPSVFFCRDLYDRVGGMNKTLNFCMDYDLWARFAASSAKFAMVDSDLSGNRWYATTKTAGQLLDLYSEIVVVQRSTFGAVSPYYVQAISDYLFSKFHSKSTCRGQLLFRWLYFKGMWLVINAPSPRYCLKGLFLNTLAKSGPIVGDTMTLRDWTREVVTLFRRKIER